MATDKEHFVEPISLFYLSPNRALASLRGIIEGLERTSIIQQTNNYLEVEFRSWLFRFVDDVEFLVEPEQRVIHTRSASRVGFSDFGANRKRIERIRRLYEAAAQQHDPITESPSH